MANRVHKNDLIKEVASRVDISEDAKGICKEVINETLETIADLLVDGKEVALPNIGVLKTKAQAARNGTDFSGNKIVIPARRRVSFTTAKSLKDRLAKP